MLPVRGAKSVVRPPGLAISLISSEQVWKLKEGSVEQGR